MGDVAEAAREMANGLGYLDGAGPEVRLWIHNLADALDSKNQAISKLLGSIHAAGFEVRTAPDGHQFLLNVQAEAAIACEIRCEG